MTGPPLEGIESGSRLEVFSCGECTRLADTCGGKNCGECAYDDASWFRLLGAVAALQAVRLLTMIKPVAPGGAGTSQRSVRPAPGRDHRPVPRAGGGGRPAPGSAARPLARRRVTDAGRRGGPQ